MAVAPVKGYTPTRRGVPISTPAPSVTPSKKKAPPIKPGARDPSAKIRREGGGEAAARAAREAHQAGASYEEAVRVGREVAKGETEVSYEVEGKAPAEKLVTEKGKPIVYTFAGRQYYKTTTGQKIYISKTGEVSKAEALKAGISKEEIEELEARKELREPEEEPKAPEPFYKAYSVVVPEAMRRAKPKETFIQQLKGVPSEVIAEATPIAAIPAYAKAPVERKIITGEIKEIREHPVRTAITYGAGIATGGVAGVAIRAIPKAAKVVKIAGYTLTGLYAAGLTYKTVVTPKPEVPEMLGRETVRAGAFIGGIYTGARIPVAVQKFKPIKIKGEVAAKVVTVKKPEGVISVVAPKKMEVIVGKEKYVVETAGVTLAKPIRRGVAISRGEFKYEVTQKGKVVKREVQVTRGITKAVKEGYAGITAYKIKGKPQVGLIGVRGREIIPGERYRATAIRIPKPTVEVAVKKKMIEVPEREIWIERGRVVGAKELAKEVKKSIGGMQTITGKRAERVLKIKQVEGVAKRIKEPKLEVPKEPITPIQRATAKDLIKGIKKGKIEIPRIPIITSPLTIPKRVPREVYVAKPREIPKEITIQKPITKPIQEPIQPVKPIPKVETPPIVEPIEEVKPVSVPIQKPLILPIIEEPIPPVVEKPIVRPAIILPPFFPGFRDPLLGRRKPTEPKKRKYRYMPSLIAWEKKYFGKVKRPKRVYAPTEIRPIPLKYKKKLKRFL